MPTLVRFLTVLVVLAVIAGGATLYLAYMVQPNTREMTIRIPSNKLTPEPAGGGAGEAPAADDTPATAPAAGATEDGE